MKKLKATDFFRKISLQQRQECIKNCNKDVNELIIPDLKEDENDPVNFEHYMELPERLYVCLDASYMIKQGKISGRVVWLARIYSSEHEMEFYMVLSEKSNDPAFMDEGARFIFN